MYKCMLVAILYQAWAHWFCTTVTPASVLLVLCSWHRYLCTLCRHSTLWFKRGPISKQGRLKWMAIKQIQKQIHEEGKAEAQAELTKARNKIVRATSMLAYAKCLREQIQSQPDWAAFNNALVIGQLRELIDAIVAGTQINKVAKSLVYGVTLKNITAAEDSAKIKVMSSIVITALHDPVEKLTHLTQRLLVSHDALQNKKDKADETNQSQSAPRKARQMRQGFAVSNSKPKRAKQGKADETAKKTP